MKVKIICIIILIFTLCLFIFSCQKKSTKKIGKISINEIALVKKLSKTNFYKKFYKYNIWPRDIGRVYIISTESVSEFWVSFNKENGIKLFNDEDIDNDKEAILKELYKIISFMLDNGIKSTIHVKNERIDFNLVNNNEIRWYANSILNQGVEISKKYYNEVTVINDNWVILKKPKN